MVQPRSSLPTAQQLELPVAGLGGGQVADEPKAAVGEEFWDLGRIQAERPGLAPEPDALDPAAGLRKPRTVAVQDRTVHIGEHQQAADGGKATHRAKRWSTAAGVR
jgi:hypothetical protein